jgi:hypothetical protein
MRLWVVATLAGISLSVATNFNRADLVGRAPNAVSKVPDNAEFAVIGRTNARRYTSAACVPGTLRSELTAPGPFDDLFGPKNADIYTEFKCASWMGLGTRALNAALFATFVGLMLLGIHWSLAGLKNQPNE